MSTVEAVEEGSESLRTFEAVAGSHKRAGFWGLLTGVTTMALGLGATFYLSVRGAEAAGGGDQAKNTGMWIALAGALAALMLSIMSGRFARALVVAKAWPTRPARRLSRWVAGTALGAGLATGAAAMLAYSAAFAAANEQASAYRQQHLGALEVLVATALCVVTFFLIARTCELPALVDEDQRPDHSIAHKRAQLTVSAASVGVLLAVVLLCAYAFAWAGLAPLGVGLASAIVLYAILRPRTSNEEAENASLRGFGRVKAVVAFIAGGASFGLCYLAFVLGYERTNALVSEWKHKQVGTAEISIAAALGAAVVFLLLLGLRSDAHLEPERTLRVGRNKLWRALMSIAAMFAVVFVCIYGFTWSGLGPLFAGAFAALVLFVATRPSLRSLADDDAELDEELSQMARAEGRARRALVITLIAGLGFTALLFAGVHLLDLRISIFHIGAILVGGNLVGLFVHSRLKPKPELDMLEALPGAKDTGGLFDDSLAEAGTFQVRQQFKLSSLLLGAASRAQYDLISDDAWCGTANEKCGWFGRLFLGGRRSLDVEVQDLDKPAMKLSRPFVWWRNRAMVTEGNREIGTVQRKWSLFRRRYVVLDNRGKELYRLVSGYVLWWRDQFRILKTGQQVGEMRKLRLPWYRRLIRLSPVPLQDRFALTIPAEADLDERRLLLGSVFLADMTHYPTQKSLRVGALALMLLVLLFTQLTPPAPNEMADDSHAPAEVGQLDDDEVELDDSFEY